MYDLSDLGLTLNQMAEVHEADPILVAAWLEAIDSPEVENPAAWFLTGIRSGVSPRALADSQRQRRIKQAERWIVNAGLFVPTETDILDELFDGPSALLRHYKGEENLREKMLDLWRLERPHGEDAEAEFLARAARNRASREGA